MDIFASLFTCRQLALRKLNPHEQNRSQNHSQCHPQKKFKYLVNITGLGRFLFLITLLNELENETINRRTFKRLAMNADRHEGGNMPRCYSICGYVAGASARHREGRVSSFLRE